MTILKELKFEEKKELEEVERKHLENIGNLLGYKIKKRKLYKSVNRFQKNISDRFPWRKWEYIRLEDWYIIWFNNWDWYIIWFNNWDWYKWNDYTYKTIKDEEEKTDNLINNIKEIFNIKKKEKMLKKIDSKDEYIQIWKKEIETSEVQILKNVIYNKKKHSFKNLDNQSIYEIPKSYHEFLNILINKKERISYKDICNVIDENDISNGTYKGNLIKLLRQNNILWKKEDIISWKNKWYKINLFDK